MTTSPLAALKRADAAVKRAEEKLNEAERERTAAVLAAVDGGAKQVDVAEALGVSRETVRQYLMVARAREGR